MGFRTTQAAADLSGIETRQRLLSSRNRQENTEHVRGDRFPTQPGGT